LHTPLPHAVHVPPVLAPRARRHTARTPAHAAKDMARTATESLPDVTSLCPSDVDTCQHHCQMAERAHTHRILSSPFSHNFETDKERGGAVQSTLASARLKCSLQVHQPWLNHGSPITTLMRTTDMRFLRVGAVRPLHLTFVAPPLPAPRAGPPSLPHSPYAAVIERMGSCWSSSTQAATSHARLRPHEAVHMLSGGARGEKRSAGRLSPPLASSAQAATG